jgi:hypothetical protein
MVTAEFMLPLRDERYDKAVRETMLADPSVQKLIRRIDDDHKLVGAGIVFIDKNRYSIQLRPFQPSCRLKPIHILLHEVPPAERSVDYAVKLRNNQRESRAIAEGVGALLSCSAAVLGWLVVTGSAGAAPITGGTSAAVTVVSYGAATASSLQCGVAVVRTFDEIAGNGNVVDVLDSQEWYSEVMRALDIISLAGVGAAGLSSFKAYRAVRTASPRAVEDILKGMTRAERKRLTREIIRVNNPGISNKLLKAMVTAGQAPKMYSQQAINTALMLHVKDAVGASLSLAGSVVGGVLNNIIVGVYEVAQ